MRLSRASGKERRKKIGPLLTAAMDAMFEVYDDDEEFYRDNNVDYAVGNEKLKNDEIVDGIIKTC